MEQYKGDAKSYEDAKLRVLTAVLATIGIKVEDDMGKITVSKDGEKIATVEISI